MALPQNITDQAAVFSPDGIYRYWLRRLLLTLSCFDCRPCVWIMLNPSRATATRDDATTRICMNYAHRWGFSDHVAVNLFALIDTYPSGLIKAADPIGPDNDEAILHAVEFARRQDGIVVAAWGAHGDLFHRGRAVLRMLAETPVYTLGLTRGGQPRFPRAVSRHMTPQRLAHG